MKLQVLIVDDTPLSRQRTRRYLADEPNVAVVGECGDADSALEAIRTLNPDLVLLDVQMPGTTGLGLLEQLPPEERPAIIFITAFDEFAVQAFAVEAVDYLLKPSTRHGSARPSPKSGPFLRAAILRPSHPLNISNESPSNPWDERSSSAPPPSTGSRRREITCPSTSAKTSNSSARP